MKRIEEVDVFLYGRKVGTLIEHDQRVFFEYDQNFRKSGVEISPYKLNTADIDFAYTNKDSFDLYGGMAGVFFDSLPDKYGMPFIYRYFEQKGFRKNDVSILHKLSFIGDRGMGALEYMPKENSLDVIAKNEIVSIKKAREDSHTILENNKDHYSIDMLMSIVTSASPVGGARPKMLVCYNKQNGLIKYNNNSLDDGYVRAIVKFDEAYPNAEMEYESIGLTRLEYLFMDMAAECNIDTPYFKLIEENGLYHFVIERFDRDQDDRKLHLCSASGLLHKDISVPKVMSYEELFKLVNMICFNQQDVKELYKRMVFNVFAINVDDHAKNFSFVMDENRKWSLSKAYDITYSKGVISEHLSTINGKSFDFNVDDLLKIAKENLIDEKEALSIINHTKKIISEFRERAEKLDIDELTIKDCWDEIEKQLGLVVLATDENRCFIDLPPARPIEEVFADSERVEAAKIDKCKTIHYNLC